MKQVPEATGMGSTVARLWMRRPRLEPREYARATTWAVLTFLGLGTLTSLWPNPWFIRMTPVQTSDLVLLSAQSVLLGLFLGMRAPGCRLRSGVKSASIGGVLTFLGFGCLLCNQLLLMLIGASTLLSAVEPLRPLMGLAGVAVLLWALRIRMRERASLL